ncbi:MAG: hypothetical protein V4722_20190 [Bacteroidota bacterium]
MKKIAIAFGLLLAGMASYAQLDVNNIAGQVLEKLTPALNLNADQKPQVGDAVTEFLSKKAEILPLQNTDPAGYASKFNQLNGGLISKLKTILVAKQMTSFLGMKPKTNNPSNVLSHLFY